jgi:YHS domain-containing protein
MKHLILFLSFAISGISLLAQDTAKGAKLNLEEGIAVKGYDLVSYFNGKPTEGKASLTKPYNGATYQFQNESNLNAFNENPEKYMPEFGGYCSYSMGTSGELVDIDPETFKIIDGKLYLFYNAYFNNTLKKWDKDEANFLKKANVNWNKY